MIEPPLEISVGRNINKFKVTHNPLILFQACCDFLPICSHIIKSTGIFQVSEAQKLQKLAIARRHLLAHSYASCRVLNGPCHSPFLPESCLCIPLPSLQKEHLPMCTIAFPLFVAVQFSYTHQVTFYSSPSFSILSLGVSADQPVFVLFFIAARSLKIPY